MLRGCLESLISQDYPLEGYEVVVVDDASTDATLTVVDAFSSEHPQARLRYLRLDRHSGANAGRNRGIEIARGRLICFIDDDVQAPRTWLSALASGFESHPRAGCFGGPISLLLEGEPPRRCRGHPLEEGELDYGREMRKVDELWSGNLAVPRESFDLAGFFNEALPLYNEELEWEHRLRVAGGTMVYLPNAWVWHRRSAEDLRISALLRRHFKRGLGQAAFFAATGRPLRARDGLRRVPRRLAHAVGRRCWWGVFEAVGQVGFAWGAARNTLGRG